MPVIPNLFRNRKIEVDGHYPCDPVENQTFFTKSKILEKAVKQVQGDENVCRHSELAAPLVCEERAIQGRVPFRVIRNRKIEVDEPKSCEQKQNSPKNAPSVKTEEVGGFIWLFRILLLVLDCYVYLCIASYLSVLRLY